VAAQLTSILQGWQIVLSVGSGTGAVYILRWYWSRINAWSEITAMIVAAVVTILLTGIHFALGGGHFIELGVHFSGSEPVVFAKGALITAGVTTIAWIIATALTPPEPDEKLLSFYRRVHPTVYGWQRIAALAPELTPVRDLGSNAFDWVMGCIVVYGSLFGIGKLVFQQWGAGIALLAIAAVAGYLIFWDLSRRGWETLSGTEQRAKREAALGAQKSHA